MKSTPDPLMTYRQASTFLSMPIGTLYALVSQRRIPHVRLSRRMVRFRPADLDVWLSGRSVAPAQQTRADE